MADSTLADHRSLTSGRISIETVRQSVQSLIKWKSTKSQTENPNLLADEEFFYLILTLKKIPPKSRVNPYKISLPNPLHLASDTQLCLIIDDRKKSKLTKADAKKKNEADEIGVDKILKLSKLRTDYVAFEAKRKLCDSYDMFLVDNRLILLLPKLLGKQFYKKKKIPVAINLSYKNWKEQIGRAIGSGLLYLRTGTCSGVKVARVSMELEEIVENVMAAVNGIVEIVPKKWDGVRSFHLKLSESLSLPIYQALPDLKLKIDGVDRVDEEVVDEEMVDEGVPAENDKKDEKLMKKSLKKGKFTEVIELDGKTKLASEDDDHEDGTIHDENEAPVVVEEVPVKKRKKAAGKLDEAMGEKKSRKDVSLRKQDDIPQKKKASSENASVKKLKKVVKPAEKDIAEDAKDKLSAKQNEIKKQKSEGTNLKEKKRGKVV